MAGDLSGVPRPVDPARIEPARSNSGVMVGETTQTEGQTTATTHDDQYKTAFIKVYQDAGVIGASMLTLLVLCVLLGWFSLRLLKMYTTLTESRDKLDAMRTAALERISQTMLTLQASLTTELAKNREDNGNVIVRLERISMEQERKLEILRRDEVILERLQTAVTRMEADIEILLKGAK
jgi:hypothetical protein